MKRNVQRHKINAKKLKPGLVASYDIRPGNREGLFWIWCFINVSLLMPRSRMLGSWNFRVQTRK